MKQSEMATKTMLGMPWLKIGYGNVDNTLMEKLLLGLSWGFSFPNEKAWLILTVHYIQMTKYDCSHVQCERVSSGN